jgi:hypothetical protein
MTINDFEYVPAPLDIEEEEEQEQITSKPGNIVSSYLASKNTLDAAISNALSSSYDFGYLMGMQDERKAVIEVLRLSGLEEAAKLLEESDD